MKRSEINSYILEAEAFFAQHGFFLPEFARWGKEDWLKNKDLCSEIIDCGLGWDITDFGSGSFMDIGLLLFTLRNGAANSPRYSKPYAEKIMMVRPGQVTPMHCHFRKQEDIINRGGGTLVFRLCPAVDGKPGTGKVSVVKDGILITTDSDSEIRIMPGESLTLVPGAFHSFWGAEEGETVMVGEVSSVNDDNTDNCFAEKRERFQKLREDVSPYRLLVSDYRELLKD